MSHRWLFVPAYFGSICAALCSSCHRDFASYLIARNFHASRRAPFKAVSEKGRVVIQIFGHIPLL